MGRSYSAQKLLSSEATLLRSFSAHSRVPTFIPSYALSGFLHKNLKLGSEDLAARPPASSTAILWPISGYFADAAWAHCNQCSPRRARL